MYQACYVAYQFKISSMNLWLAEFFWKKSSLILLNFLSAEKLTQKLSNLEKLQFLNDKID